MHPTRLPVLLVMLATACGSVLATSRRIGAPQPPRELGCNLVIVQGPSDRPAVVIGEVSCEAGEAEEDRMMCREQIRDRVCELGADGFSPQMDQAGRITAVALKFTGGPQGPGPGGPGPGWGPGPQQPPQQPLVQQPPPPPPPNQPAQCVPPCPAGSHCSADGRRCEPDAGTPGVQAGLTDEQIQEALDRIRRRVLRCRPRGDENDVTVELEIEPGGSVASVRIDGPLANTDAGGCIEQAVFRATFPTFEGANRSVHHSFAPANP